MRKFFVLVFICVFTATLSAFSQSTVSDDDLSTSFVLRKKFKNEPYAATKMVTRYTFEKGLNDLKQPVVKVKEVGSVEFISLKDIAVFQFFQFHNRFVKLKSFHRYDKYGTKYPLTAKKGFDRSVTDDNIFFDDNRVQIYSFRFLEKGKVAKVVWETEYTDGKYLTRNFFHEFFPVAEKLVEFEIPSWLDIAFIEKNFEGYKIDKIKSTSGKVPVMTFRVKEFPAVKSEYRDLGIAYTHPHIIIQIKSFEDNGKKVTGFTNTQDLYNWYSSLYKMAKNEPETLKSQVSQIIAGKKNDEEKAKAIYYWVQDNIRYIAYEDGYAGYIPSTAQEVYAEKYGDCKGMANLLTEMLKLAGYKAHFTWIGTQHIPYDRSVPAMCLDNHAITTLYLNGKEYFLDGTEKFAPLGENAFRIQGKSALIEKGESFDEKKVPSSNASDHKMKTVASLNLNNGKLKGHVKVSMHGNERKDFHQYYHELPKHAQQDELKDMVEFGNTNLTATNIKSSDLSNREIPVEIEGDIDLTNTITQIGEDLYVGIDFFPKNLQNYVPDDKRKRGYDFESVFAFEDDIELTVPADKKFTDIPDKLVIDEALYSFNGSYEVIGNKMRLRKTLVIKNNIIPANQLASWKDFLEKIREFNSYLISITKK